MPETEVTICLKQVHCKVEGEVNKDGDDLYLKYYKDSGSTAHRYPKSSGSGYQNIKAGEDWDVNLNIAYKNTLRIDLFDNDATGQTNDPLGSHNYSRDDASKSLRLDTNSERTGQYEFVTGPGPG